MMKLGEDTQHEEEYAPMLSSLHSLIQCLIQLFVALVKIDGHLRSGGDELSRQVF